MRFYGRFAPRKKTSLVESLAKSLGSDPMHDSRRNSLRDSFFYAGRAEIRIFTPPDIKFRTILVRQTFS